MSKEKQIQEYENKQLIDELSKMPPMVVATAYLYALNYTLYGEDVTEKWETTVQNASALEIAYRKGYHDALNWIPVSEKPPKENETVIASAKYGVCPEAKYTKETGWHWVSESGVKNYWTELEGVEAWMPLPRRYVAAESTKEETKNFLAGSSLEIRPMNIDIKTEIWVPVSEKTPEDDRDYLVTRRDIIGRPVVATRYFSKDLFKVDEFDFVDKKGISGWCEYDSEYGWYVDDKVIAWCELPEPYKAEGSNS